MIAIEVLADLRHRGVELFVEDGTLRYRAPRGMLTPELREILSAHKTELVALLQGGEPRHMTPADCFELLMEMHASIRAAYLAGALSLLGTDAELSRRFHETEDRIDVLAKVPGGPTRSDFRDALASHAAVWRELVARYRARQERQEGRRS